MAEKSAPPVFQLETLQCRAAERRSWESEALTRVGRPHADVDQPWDAAGVAALEPAGQLSPAEKPMSVRDARPTLSGMIRL